MTGAAAKARRVLVLGGPAAGKTTFLIQLYGRVSAGTGKLRARGAPASLASIEEGFRRLQQGVAVAHTPHGTDTSLSLAAVDFDGRSIDITVPDYAGEDLRRLVDERRLHDRWRREAESDQWLLLILQRQLSMGSRVVGSGSCVLGVGVVVAIGTRPRPSRVGGVIALRVR